MKKEDLIKKWLADELAPAEQEAFGKLDDFDMHSKIIEGAQYFKASEINQADGIKEIYAKMERSQHISAKKNTWYQPIFKIASIIAVVLGVSFFYLSNKGDTITTLASQKTTIQLPDASEVIINSKSEISFNKSDWEDNREVNLKGEAFFKVEKGSAFDVITDQGKVTVLGTQFNVKSRENYFEVKCFEGLVKVKGLKYTEHLPAGSTLRIVDGHITFETVNDDRPQWLINISSFKSVPFYEVINEFERQYNVTISASNVDVNRLFTGGFTHNDLQNGLKSITLPLDLTYSIDTNTNISLLKNE